MKVKSLIKMVALSLIIANSYLAMAIEQQQFSGINQLTFYNDKFNKEFVGNGFLIKHKSKIYAVTVKHALLEAQTPKMKKVYIKDHIKSWQIHPNKVTGKEVVLGKLINSDKNEAIDMKVLKKDWLVFELESNNSNLVPLELRKLALVKGERLTAYGCSYANQAICIQDKYDGHYISSEANNLRVDMSDLDLSQLRGLSGSPVVDRNGLLVGIVSNVMKSKSGEGFDFAPANLNYLLDVLVNID